jgi:hypothetical protein
MEALLPIRRRAGSAWPYRPRPLPDELLTSYLLRLASGLDLRPPRFLSAVWGSSRSLLNQDLDNYAPPHIATRIAAGTCITLDEVEQMTLASYAGTLLLNHNHRGRNPWLLPTTIKSNDRQRRGLQYCPECLAEDAKPYFRRRWRLAFVTICTQHRILLRDGCPSCGEIIHLHRAPTFAHCFKCGESLCTGRRSDAPRALLFWQDELEQALDRGWAYLGNSQLYSHLHFSIVRQIATLLVNGRRAPSLRRVVAPAANCSRTGFDKPTRRQPIEYLTLKERYRLFRMVAHLTRDWPGTFVSACDAAGIHRSHAIKDMSYVPFAYERVLREHLDLLFRRLPQ